MHSFPLLQFSFSSHQKSLSMASYTNTTYGSERTEPVSPNTTYVQADPSNFRTVVQKLTGAPDDPSTPKLPLTNLSSRFINSKPTISEMGPRKPAFKLHERRQSAKKLELNLTTTTTTINNTLTSSSSLSPSGSFSRMVMVSPVTPLELLARGSPRTPVSPCEEEERAIAHKGFYLHPSPRTTPRGPDPPELLPLFPLHSPRERENSSASS